MGQLYKCAGGACGHPHWVANHTNISGSLRVRGGALMILAGSPSWSWLDPRSPAEGVEVLSQGAEGVCWRLEGLFRNLGVALVGDVLGLMPYGEVRAELTLDCQDGVHEREYLRVDETGAVLGRGECMNAELELREAERIELVGLNLGGSTPMRLGALLESGLGVRATGPVLGVVGAQDLPQQCACACGGLIEDEGELRAVCESLEALEG